MNKKFKDILITLLVPLVIYAVMEGLCLAVKGRHLISTMLDIKTLVRLSGVSALAAFALSFNLSCGRMDLSLGAQRLAGTILGGLIALSLGLSGIWFMVFAFVFGALFGILTGLTFIATRVPPMVLGVGLGLVWECVPYVTSQGKGLDMFGVAGMEILTTTPFIIATVIFFAVIVSVLMNSTVYGYQMRAIQGSQYIARNSGINIFRHAVWCYALAGGFVCIAGAMEASYSTQMGATLGLASNGPVLGNMFPMMLGGYMGRRTNQATGIIVASVSLKLLTYGLTILELSEANANVVNMTLFILFLVFLANKDYFSNKKAQKQRILLAQATLQRA